MVFPEPKADSMLGLSSRRWTLEETQLLWGMVPKAGREGENTLIDPSLQSSDNAHPW
jgi:hypothetical protein